jgi:propionate CoA-transferase
LSERKQRATTRSRHGGALRDRQPVLYVTERCVFRRAPDGLELIETAPGIDIRRDILPSMDFVPIIREPARTMDPALFGQELMRTLVPGK